MARGEASIHIERPPDEVLAIAWSRPRPPSVAADVSATAR